MLLDWIVLRVGWYIAVVEAVENWQFHTTVKKEFVFRRMLLVGHYNLKHPYVLWILYERGGLKNFENIVQWALHRYTTMLMSVRHAFNEARNCIRLGKNHLNSSPVALHFLTWKFQKAAGFSPLEVTLLKLILLQITSQLQEIVISCV